MQPTLRQVPPRASSPFGFFQPSMQAVFSPSCAARTAAMYPPGPAPMTTTSNVCAMIFPLPDPDSGDVDAEPRTEAGGERMHVLQEHGGVLHQPQEPERGRHRDPHRERDGEMPRDVDREDGVEEHRE